MTRSEQLLDFLKHPRTPREIKLKFGWSKDTVKRRLRDKDIKPLITLTQDGKYVLKVQYEPLGTQKQEVIKELNPELLYFILDDPKTMDDIRLRFNVTAKDLNHPKIQKLITNTVTYYLAFSTKPNSEHLVFKDTLFTHKGENKWEVVPEAEMKRYKWENA